MTALRENDKERVTVYPKHRLNLQAQRRRPKEEEEEEFFNHHPQSKKIIAKNDLERHAHTL